MEYIVNDNVYKVIKLLGHGKGGYSYLVNNNENKQFVLKKIHHEPCSYYNFGNKLETEINDYKILKEIGINMPVLYDVDYNNEIIIKEYIDGNTIDQIIIDNKMKDIYYQQIKDISKILYENNLNIDYYPTNFVVLNDKLYYVDYECNKYMDEWNYENWAKKYWSMTDDFIKAFIK